MLALLRVAPVPRRFASRFLTDLRAYGILEAERGMG
jgi:hypothetical protein